MKTKAYITDTFQGELNFSWKREIELDKDFKSTRAMLKYLREKFEIIEGTRLVKKYSFHDFKRWDFVGSCTALCVEYYY